MSVNVADLVVYGSASMPDADGATTGGAVDFTTRVVFNDISPTGTMDYVSSSASDTAATIVLTGRDSTGVVVTESKTFTGTTLVTGSQSFERLLKGVIGGTTAVGDLAAISHTAVVSGTAQGGAAAVTGGSGTLGVPARIRLAAGQAASCSTGQIIRLTNNTPSGVQNTLRWIVGISTAVDPAANADDVYVNRDWSTVPSSATTYTVSEGMLFDLSPNQVVQIRRPFYNVSANASGGATLTFYEKVFEVNNNTVTALTGASIATQSQSPSLPSGVQIQMALANVLNDTATVANRQTAPASGITAFTTGTAPQSINVPSPQNLPSGAAPNAAGAQGAWLKLVLPAGVAPYKGTETMRAQGGTT